MGAVLSKARSNVDFDNAKLWWSATAFYCAYVVLGGFSPAAHEHVFTRDPKKPLDKEVLKGKAASFCILGILFSCIFTVRSHVSHSRAHGGLVATDGYLNLRNRPGIDLNVLAKEKTVRYLRHTHRLSGYLYVYSGFLKGITASLMAIYSRLARECRSRSYGSVWLVGLLFTSCCISKIAAGDVAGHKRLDDPKL